MTCTLDISDGLTERLDRHLEEAETIPEFVEEPLSMDETGSAFRQAGYSE